MSKVNNTELEALIKEVVSSILSKEAPAESRPAERGDGNRPQLQVTVADYPLGKNRCESVKTPSGKSMQDISLQNVLQGKISPEDVRITPETLYLQAQIAEQVNRPQFAQNLRRAAELTAIPDQRVLEIYNALRPYRSTKAELLAIADELENKYQATINAAFVRQAAEIYEKRNRLRR